MKIRTTYQARKLRPIATERARHSKLRKGDIAYFGGIGWYPVKIESVINSKPYRIFTVTSAKTGRGYFPVTGLGMFADKGECYKYGGIVRIAR